MLLEYPTLFWKGFQIVAVEICAHLATRALVRSGTEAWSVVRILCHYKDGVWDQGSVQEIFCSKLDTPYLR